LDHCASMNISYKLKLCPQKPARTQSPKPLCASVKDNDPTENNGQKNRKSKPF